MKILSKYKDYYDYLVGKYGIDSKVVLDRTEGFTIKLNDLKPSVHWREKETRLSTIRLAICGKLYVGFVDDKGIAYWGKNREKVSEVKDIKFPYAKKVLQFEGSFSKEQVDIDVKSTSLNDDIGCPIVLTQGGRGNVLYPCLEELGIASIIPAEDLYQQLYNWTSHRNEPDVIDTRDDKTKIENAGFDLKKSFRHRK